VNTDSQKSTITANNTSTNNTSQQSSSEGWSGAELQFYQADEMKKWILLTTDLLLVYFVTPI
jgi:hypothetical protein